MAQQQIVRADKELLARKTLHYQELTPMYTLYVYTGSADVPSLQTKSVIVA